MHSKKSFLNHPVEHWATELFSFSCVSCRVPNRLRIIWACKRRNQSFQALLLWQCSPYSLEASSKLKCRRISEMDNLVLCIGYHLCLTRGLRPSHWATFKDLNEGNWSTFYLCLILKLWHFRIPDRVYSTVLQAIPVIYGGSALYTVEMQWVGQFPSKFKIHLKSWNGNIILSEKICDLLLIWNISSLFEWDLHFH